jgi:Tryptophan halogenase
VKVGSYLKQKALSRGVNLRETTITEVVFHEDASIKSLIEEGGNILSGDLYVDCS